MKLYVYWIEWDIVISIIEPGFQNRLLNWIMNDNDDVCVAHTQY